MKNFDSKYETFYNLKREYKALQIIKAPDWHIAKIAQQGIDHAKQNKTTN